MKKFQPYSGLLLIMMGVAVLVIKELFIATSGSNLTNIIGLLLIIVGVILHIIVTKKSTE